MNSTAGLADILKMGDSDGRDRLVFAALATSIAASPLASVTYRAKSVSALGRLAAAVAAPVATYAFFPASFAAEADAAVVAGDLKAGLTALPELKSILSLYQPYGLTKLLAKNCLASWVDSFVQRNLHLFLPPHHRPLHAPTSIFMQVLIKVNMHLVERMEHEKQAINAEARGEVPPEEPEFPDLRPALGRGLQASGRELAIATTRRVYEHIAASRLPPHRAQALLRDAKTWARDVLAVKYRSATAGRRFFAYYFAVLHSQALFNAADCTVSVAQHSYRAWRRWKKEQRPVKLVLVYWARGVGLQIARCSLTLLVTAAGAALGSLIRPGTGTFVALTLSEVVMGIASTQVINILLE